MPPVYSKQGVALMAHLLRRAGFGATVQELDAYLDKGYEASVEALLNPGGNDYLNCVVPYSDPNYIDNRPNVRLTEDDVIPLDHGYGLNPAMGPIKDLYNQGKVAIIHGVGYPVPNRSHFRSMDIWHTAEPTRWASRAGWAGRSTRSPQMVKMLWPQSTLVPPYLALW